MFVRAQWGLATLASLVGAAAAAIPQSAATTGCPLITHVRLWSPAGANTAPTDVRILGSNDGPDQGWETLATLPEPALAEDPQVLRLSRPIRRRFLACGFPATNRLQLAEIEFWSGCRKVTGQPFAWPSATNRSPRSLLSLFDGDPSTAFTGSVPDRLVVGLDFGEGAQAAPPEFQPPPGTYETPPEIHLSSATPGAAIQFWTDGGQVLDQGGRRYSEPVQLARGAVLAAVARRAGFADSALRLGAYRVRQPLPPPAVVTNLYEEALTASMPIRVAQWRQMEAYVRTLENAGPPAPPRPAKPAAPSSADFAITARADFARRLGWPPPGFLTEPGRVRLEPVAQDDLATYYRCWIPVTPELETYGLYLVPRQAKRPAPLIIAQHGGGGFPELATFHGGSNYHDLVRGAAARGWVVFAPLLLFYPYVDRDHDTPIPPDVRADLDRRLRARGATLAAVEVAKLHGALTALLARPEIDPDRVAMAGLSYGGFYTLYTAALEPRIRVAAVSGSFRDWGTPEAGIANPAAWQSGGRLNDATPAELAALICPRPLLVQAGINDRLMRIGPTRTMVAEARCAYERLGGSGAFRFIEFPGGHEFIGAPVWRFIGEAFRRPNRP